MHKTLMTWLGAAAIAALPFVSTDAVRAQHPRPQGSQSRRRKSPDDLAGVVAVRLRKLRPVLHPNGLAQCRHLPCG